MVDDEQIVLLDEKWQAIGVAPKLASHHANTPLHLAFSCYVFNDVGEVLVTQRALNKKTWPGIWTNTCCGHPAPGETIEAAIHRRLKQELGLNITDLKVMLPKFRYREEMNGIVENECCPVYFAKTTAEPVLNPLEMMDYKWLSWDEFVAQAKNPANNYSIWCKQQIPQLSSFIKKSPRRG